VPAVEHGCRIGDGPIAQPEGARDWAFAHHVLCPFYCATRGNGGAVDLDPQSKWRPAQYCARNTALAQGTVANRSGERSAVARVDRLVVRRRRHDRVPGRPAGYTRGILRGRENRRGIDDFPVPARDAAPALTHAVLSTDSWFYRVDAVLHPGLRPGWHQ